MFSKLKFLLIGLIFQKCQSTSIDVDEKLIFPDIFSIEASNEPMTWIEALQVRLVIGKNTSNQVALNWEPSTPGGNTGPRR